MENKGVPMKRHIWFLHWVSGRKRGREASSRKPAQMPAAVLGAVDGSAREALRACTPHGERRNSDNE